MKGLSSPGNATGTGCSRDSGGEGGGGGARRLLRMWRGRGRLLPVAMSLSDNKEEVEADAGDERQAPWLRPGGYWFMMEGTSRRIPAFQGEDDDLTDQPWDMKYVDAAMV